MLLISTTLLAVAVSFDSLTMGITYGLNSINIPSRSKIVLSLVSGVTLFISMVLGDVLEQRLNPAFTNTLGGFIFIMLGLYNLWRSYRPSQEKILINLRIPILGVIVQVFQEPLKADSDGSHHITMPEALILGGALALDAIAAGLGAAVLGLPHLSTTCSVIFASYAFISLGLNLGKHFTELPAGYSSLRWIPGTIVIFLGIFKVCF